MDQNINKVLALGVGVLFFVAVASIGLYMFSQGKDLTNVASEEISSTKKELLNTTYEQYNETTITGSQVVSAINKFKEKTGDIQLIVQTKKNTTTYISGGSAEDLTTRTETVLNNEYKNCKDSTSSTYINPSADFSTSLETDKNGVVRVIKFIQK